MMSQPTVYDEDGNVVCQECQAHHTPGYPHTCPEWMRLLVKMRREEESTTPGGSKPPSPSDTIR